MTDPTTATRPKVSIIIPGYDERWSADDVVRAWVKQDCPPEDFEIIAVCDATRPKLRERMRRALRLNDRLVEHPGRLNEPAFYNTGARSARGDIFVIAELHVLCTPTLVSRTVAHFRDTADDAAVVLCGSARNDCEVGRISHLVFQREVAGEDRVPAWTRFSLRGTGIRREVWQRFGGMDERYHRIAELDFALRLMRAGGTIGWISDTRLSHRSDQDWLYLRETVRLGGWSIARMASADPTGSEPRVPPSPPRFITSALSRRGAAALLRLRADRLFHGTGGRSESIGRMAADALSSIFGPSWAVHWCEGEANLLAGRSVREFYRGEHERGADTLFACLGNWHLKGFLEFARDHERVTHWQPHGDDALDPVTVDFGCLIGFYEREQCPDRRRRWSDSAAAVRLRLPAGRWRVRIDCRSPVPLNRRDVRFLFEGRSIAPRVVEDGIELDLGRTAGNSTLLGWSCVPYVPADHGSDDHRTLGLDIVSMKFQRV